MLNSGASVFNLSQQISMNLLYSCGRDSACRDAPLIGDNEKSVSAAIELHQGIKRPWQQLELG